RMASTARLPAGWLIVYGVSQTQTKTNRRTMKPQRITTVGNSPASPASCRRASARPPAGMIASFGLIASLLFLAMVGSASAQTVTFRAGQVRVTVPVNSSGSTVITNFVNIAGLDTNAPVPVDFSVTGLPAGAEAVLTDTNLNPLLSATTDTN